MQGLRQASGDERSPLGVTQHELEEMGFCFAVVDLNMDLFAKVSRARPRTVLRKLLLTCFRSSQAMDTPSPTWNRGPLPSRFCV